MTEPESARAPLDLRRPRDLGALIADSFSIYFRNFGAFLAIVGAVVVPVQLVVGGIGLGQLSSGYDETPGPGELGIPLAANFLVVSPLTTAMCIYALLDLSEGRKPRVRSAIQRGLDVFAPLLVAVLIYAGAVALGLLALILPGIYLLVRGWFVIQATVVEGRRGPEAFRHSWDLVAGSWWRVFGIVLVANLLVGGMSALISQPFLSAAESTDSAVFQLVGSLLGALLFAAPAALISTLLYFDVRARKGA